MNKRKLYAMMALYGDTGGSLAKALGIARTTFSAKINETNGAEFTQTEILNIKKRYILSPEQINEIFFENKLS